MLIFLSEPTVRGEIVGLDSDWREGEQWAGATQPLVSSHHQYFDN